MGVYGLLFPRIPIFSPYKYHLGTRTWSGAPPVLVPWFTTRVCNGGHGGWRGLTTRLEVFLVWMNSAAIGNPAGNFPKMKVAGNFPKIEGGWMMFLFSSHRCNLVYALKNFFFLDPKQCHFLLQHLQHFPRTEQKQSRFRKTCFCTYHHEKNTLHLRTTKLPYIKGLGCRGIWLSPIFQCLGWKLRQWRRRCWCLAQLRGGVERRWLSQWLTFWNFSMVVFGSPKRWDR